MTKWIRSTYQADAKNLSTKPTCTPKLDLPGIDAQDVLLILVLVLKLA